MRFAEIAPNYLASIASVVPARDCGQSDAVADTGRPQLDETLPSRGGGAADAGMPDLGSRYRLDLELGRGGMGRVSPSRDLKLR